MRIARASGLEGTTMKRGASVFFCDPYIPSIVVRGQTLKAIELTPNLLQAMDCVAILTDHSAFDYSVVAKYSSMILGVILAML